MLLGHQQRKLPAATLFRTPGTRFYSALRGLFAALHAEEAEPDTIIANARARLDLPVDPLRRTTAEPGGPSIACAARRRAALR
eukprot:9341554-Lingulodinium_polyedra.AAC.1